MRDWSIRGERNKKLKTPEWTEMEKAEQKGSGYHIF